ncbi:MAG: hypothetical protein IT364_01630 [Candidatus Hydrogenedentes bacterium]|nr:hypothetical protein [Candidatus Hydrogenedentota bacterium]
MRFALLGCVICLGGVVLSGCVTANIEPQVAVTVRDQNGALNVMNYGATPDGKTDNTEAFQKALDAAGADGGGVVAVPTGLYCFDGSLTFPKAVTLRGTFSYSPAHAGIRDNSDEKPVFGTVLMPRANAGAEAAAPFITLQTNAVLQGVCIHYPEQKPDAPEPVPYPYAIAMRGNNPAVIDVELLNPYNGIDAGQNQRALIRNVHGQPIHIGIYVDSIYDIGRIENVHWNPWWTINTPIYQWQMDHGIGFLFGRTDWHYVINTFCFGSHIGYQFIETKAGVTNGNFLGIGADNCQTALEVQGSAPFGILITNGEFVSFNGPEPTMIRVTNTNKGSVRFNNCAFWGPCNRIAVVDGEGTVGFSDCTFVQWGHREEETHAVDVAGGSILVRGCEFREDKKQVRLGPGVQRAIVSENLFKGTERITNESTGTVVITGNAASKVQ